MRFTCLSVLFVLLCFVSSFAQLSMPAIFSDHMVLQQQIKIPLWGNANAGAAVNVLFLGKNYETQADAAGKWKLYLPSQRYGGPYSLKVMSGEDSLRFENVLIGEVWLCSGQSNMEMPLEGWPNGDGSFRYPIDSAETEIAAAAFPNIRLVTIKDTFMTSPQSIVLLESKGWQPCSPQTVRTFSSTAYFFAREIYQKTGVPIGLINSAYGGTVAEWWTPKEYLQGIKDFEKEFDNPKNYLSGLYNAMIASIIPYGIRGVIWYQGEFNAGRGEQYAALFPRLIRGWRDKWQQGDFPFYFVQLPITGEKDLFSNNWQWAELREAQSRTLAVPNTAMTVTIDLPDNDLHPRNKQDFGKRLALIPLAKIYQKEKHYTAPIYKSYRVRDRAIELSFDHIEEGLHFDGPTPLGFVMAGADSVFYPAHATIRGDKIVVTCDSVKQPVAVRYAWAGNPPNNLRSKAGLPVSPFRTDRWQGAIRHVASKWSRGTLRLPTRWSWGASPENALPEYPRPQLVRKQWTNLNGLWDYAITDTSSLIPQRYNGQILVPYPLESALSGVQQRLSPEQYLWYRNIIVHKTSKAKRTLLHFGAVDNQATVFVNGKQVGKHAGGYTAFTFDISDALRDGDNEITVRVYDPTDKGVWPHGKQVTNPANIYYTPSSGIWQTVWLETVPEAHISDLRLTPDIDNKVLRVSVHAPKGYSAKLTVLNNRSIVSEVVGKTGELIEVPVFDPKLWSPDQPFLYDLKVELLKGNKVVDEATSYFGMRKVSVGKDSAGFYRVFLNNKYVYNLGTLDQGFWPDGLYTAPTDEALRFDIAAIKAMGFNTIRKHIKVEPARWYYHADKLGMIVWQDFVNPHQQLPEGSKPAFEKQLNETIEQLYNHPCITTWVLFNERWGRYDQERLTKYVKQKDPSRLLNAHSGELLWVNEKLRDTANNPWVASDIADVHAYPDPINVPDTVAKGKVKILGEFGGIGVFIPDHQWLSNKSWGYVQVMPAQLLGKYTVMNQHLQLLEREGLAGSIYTQPFDVEGEENGIMTYDREIIKMPFAELRKIHAPLNPAMGKMPEVYATNADVTDPGILYSQLLQEYINGKRESAFLKKLSMMAGQVGDKDGVRRISKDYITSLQVPLSEDDIRSVAQFTTSTKDAGFAVVRDNAEAFKKVIGERQYVVNMMNMIYKGDMQPMIEGVAAPDWAAIENKVRPFGQAGEEMLLRAKSIHFLNAQDWRNYLSAAQAYLAKYGANVRESERKMFQEAIDEHSH